jgi:oligogalacturonide lyase
MAVFSYRSAFSNRSTRRSFVLSGFAAAGALASDSSSQKGQTSESEWVRYIDSATEFQVYRLTDPAYSSTLPATYNRVITRNSSTLLYCSERSGTPQAFRMDLKSGDTVQLTDRKELDGSSLALLPDGRSFCYFADRTLYLTSIGTLRERPIYTIPEGWERCEGLSIGADGGHVMFGEQRGDTSRLRVVSLTQGAVRTVLEAPFTIAHPMERPQHAQILYRQAGKGLWLTSADGKQNRELKLAAGGVGPTFWSADGKMLQYLHFPDDPKQLNDIREYAPDQAADKPVAKTSQFVHFGCNRDTSVFVGASRNAASPTVLLMLRVTRRELTLCEHRAKNPATVAPLFAPDAQRIYFQSDQHGKPALYSVHVERLVEKIEADTA